MRIKNSSIKFVLSLLVFIVLLSQAGFAQSSDVEMRKLAGEVYHIVNRYRASKGLSTLRPIRKLSEIAKRHSDNMAAGRVSFSHRGFESRTRKVKSYAEMDYNVVGENLFMSNTSKAKFPADALKGWINSPGHKKTMEGDYTYTGLAVSKNSRGFYYVTQIFVKLF